MHYISKNKWIRIDAIIFIRKTNGSLSFRQTYKTSTNTSPHDEESSKLSPVHYVERRLLMFTQRTKDQYSRKKTCLSPSCCRVNCQSVVAVLRLSQQPLSLYIGLPLWACLFSKLGTIDSYYLLRSPFYPLLFLASLVFSDHLSTFISYFDIFFSNSNSLYLSSFTYNVPL